MANIQELTWYCKDCHLKIKKKEDINEMTIRKTCPKCNQHVTEYVVPVHHEESKHDDKK